MKLIHGIYHAEEGRVLMINLVGALREVRPDQVEDMRALGWVSVSNPRRSYYPEYNRSAGGSKPSQNIVENLEESDVLPGVFIP